MPRLPRAALSASLAIFVTITAVSPSVVFGQSDHVLTDHDLATYAATPFDKRTMMFKHLVLGKHNGASVIADFPCGDICPDYTRRIIHYELPPGTDCAAVGGVDQTERIPQGPAVMPRRFCEPKAVIGVHP
jgi:hypothetical protein